VKWLNKNIIIEEINGKINETAETDE